MQIRIENVFYIHWTRRQNFKIQLNVCLFVCFLFVKCISGTAVFRMVEQLHEGPQYIMVLGPVLSTIATATAEVSHHWNLTQVSSSTLQRTVFYVLSSIVIFPLQRGCLFPSLPETWFIVLITSLSLCYF